MSVSTRSDNTLSISSDPYKIMIETPRLAITSYSDADFEESAKLYGDPEITQYFDHGKPRSSEEVRDLVAKIGHEFFDQQKPYGLFSIRNRTTQDFIGHIDFMPGPSNQPEEVEVGYIVHKKFQRQGFATEALNALIYDFIPYLAQKKLASIAEVMATFHPDNEPSGRLLKKVGMQFEKAENRFGQSRLWYRLILKESTHA